MIFSTHFIIFRLSFLRYGTRYMCDPIIGNTIGLPNIIRIEFDIILKIEF